MTSRHNESDEDIERDFASLVTMSTCELADWLRASQCRAHALALPAHEWGGTDLLKLTD